MCFSYILWLMVIDCLSVFLFGFDYLPVFVGEKFLFFYFVFFHLFLHFSISDISYFSCSLSSSLNLPASALRGSSYTDRNSTHVVLYIWMIWGSWERRRWIFQVSCSPLPYLMGDRED